MPFDKLKKVSGRDGGSLLAKYRQEDKFVTKNELKVGGKEAFIVTRDSKNNIVLYPNKNGVPVTISEDTVEMLGISTLDFGGTLDGLRFEGGSKQLNPLGDKLPSTSITPQRTVTQVPPWEKAIIFTQILKAIGI